MSPNTAQVTVVLDREDALPTRELRSLQRAGYDAGWEGRNVQQCPYRFNPVDPDAPVDWERAQAWVRGFVAGRTDARIHRTSTPQHERAAAGTPGLI